MSWLSELLRVSVFPAAPLTDLGTSLWEQQLGSEPDHREFQPKALKRLERGTFELGELVLKQEPTRVEWLYRAKRDDSAQLTAPARLGDFNESLGPFEQMVSRWLASDPFPILRLAFGCSLVLPVDDASVGREKLGTFLPILKIDPEKDIEIQLRLNRPVDSKNVDGLSLNRLSDWSVRQFLLFSFGAGGRSVNSDPVNEEIVCHLSLDINTAQDRAEPLPASKIPDLLAELIQHASKISRKGLEVR